jgi:predicted 3-demethylubiquinone-9 3-methyltransferase (glyoxalase superfamily)
MSLLFSCANAAEAEAVTGMLAAGGERQPGGWVRDKYGVSWQVCAN